MKLYISTSLLLIFFAMPTFVSRKANAKTDNVIWQQPTTRRRVSIPHSIVLPVVIPQPSSPLKFIDAKVFAFIDGGTTEYVKLLNVSKKTITGYRIQNLTLAGDDGGWLVDGLQHSEMIQPDKYLEIGAKTGHDAPITEALRGKLNFQGPMQAIYFFMVTKVRFLDGSSYDAESDFMQLKVYLEKSSACVK